MRGNSVARSLLGITMNLKEFGIAAAALAAIFAADYAFQIANIRPVEVEQQQTVQEQAPAPQFTKASFQTEVYGKTKEQIRAEFGKPDNVDDGSDSWYYWHLPVYDETAGIQVNNTKIKFEGIAGPGDMVAQVSYP